jgi:hypothetical protein
MVLLFWLVLRAKESTQIALRPRVFLDRKKQKSMRRDVLAFGSLSLVMLLLLVTTIWYLLTHVH